MFPCRFLPAALVAASSLLSFPAASQADPSAVGLRVEQNVKSVMTKPVPFTRTQHRGLTVYLSNNSAEPTNFKIKHVLFGRSIRDHEIVSVGQGEHPVTVKPSDTEKVDLPVATIIAVEPHIDLKTKKQVAASGATFVGHGVQILQGDKVVAEVFDPPSLKVEWGKALPLPGTKPAAPSKPTTTPVKPKQPKPQVSK